MEGVGGCIIMEKSRLLKQSYKIQKVIYAIFRLLVLFAIGKYVLNGNGEAKNELKTTICHKLMVIIGLASGLAFLNVIRKVAIALVAA